MLDALHMDTVLTAVWWYLSVKQAMKSSIMHHNVKSAILAMMYDKFYSNYCTMHFHSFSHNPYLATSIAIATHASCSPAISDPFTPNLI
jgi:hypothetical protein